MKGLLESIKDSNHATFTLYSGELGCLSFKKTFSDITGLEMTDEENARYEKLLNDAEFRKAEEAKKFLDKWGEEVVKLHTWLGEKFGSPYEKGYHNTCKSWKLSSWLDNSDQSEDFELEWNNGNYSIKFNSEDGYGNVIVVKPSVSEEYIYKCIDNW